MKAYGGDKLQLRSFLNSVLAGSYETMHYPKLGARTYVVEALRYKPEGRGFRSR